MSEFLDENTLAFIDEHVRMGIPRDWVLRAAGVTAKQYRDILRLAGQGEEPHATWVETLDQAAAAARVEHLKVIAQSPDYRAREKALQMASDGQGDYQKTFDWVLRVVQEESSDQQFERILCRLDTEEPGQTAAAVPPEREPQIH